MPTTRCLIAFQHSHGTLQGILLNHGGDPTWIGKMLNRYYLRKEEALALISRGNLRWLGLSLEECQPEANSKALPLFTSVMHLLHEAEALNVEWCYVKPHKSSWIAYDQNGAQVVVGA